MNEFRKAISAGLSRTRDLLLTDVSDLFRSGRGLTNDSLEDLEDLLLSVDLGVDTVQVILDRLEEATRERKIEDPDAVLSLVAGVAGEMLKGVAPEKDLAANQVEKPHVILMVGVNGSGKTTAIGKIAWKHVKMGRKVVIAAADTYRAAAVEQLQEWSDRANAYCVRSHEGADPASVAYDALDAAIAREADLLLIDTAGRLHTKEGLMEELAKIRRVVSSRLEGAPHETLLVLDATTGQNALIQAREFKKMAGITGMILTKLDGTARGGIVVSIARELELPVVMVGVGEGIEDLHPFDAQEFATAMVRSL
jgi:fused signal recognition particle receptor